MASAVYFTLDKTDHGPLPVAPTAAGTVWPSHRATVGKDKDKNATHLDLELFNWARATARGFFAKVVATVLGASGLFCFLAFLSVMNGVDQDAKFLTALSVVINWVAAVHYRWIDKIRSFHAPRWFYSTLKFQDRNEKDDAGEHSDWTPYATWNEHKAIGVEMMVDALRHSDWLVTMPLLVVKLYKLVNRPSFDDYDPNIFHSVEAAAGVSIVMILLGAFVRIGLDEIWDTKAPLSMAFGVLFFVASGTCLGLLLVDLGNAAAPIAGINGGFLRSFFYVWIGYPIVALVGIVVRFWRNWNRDDYYGGYGEYLSLFKDLAFGLLDIWSKAIFGLWTAYTAFGQSLFAAGAAAPHDEWRR